MINTKEPQRFTVELTEDDIDKAAETTIARNLVLKISRCCPIAQAVIRTFPHIDEIHVGLWLVDMGGKKYKLSRNAMDVTLLARPFWGAVKPMVFTLTEFGR